MKRKKLFTIPDVMPALRKFGFLKRGWLFVWDSFASDGASFRSAMEYCDEQYWYNVGKTIRENEKRK